MDKPRNETNGSAMAAFLASAIGSFAVGGIVLLDQIGLFPVPALYGPAGGVSSRTTSAALVWILAWALLHRRWLDKEVNGQAIFTWCLVLIGMGLLFTFPPFWNLL